MDILLRIMCTIIIDIWIFQLMMYFQEGAKRDYEMSLKRSEIEEEIKECAEKVIEQVKGDFLE